MPHIEFVLLVLLIIAFFLTTATALTYIIKNVWEVLQNLLEQGQRSLAVITRLPRTVSKPLSEARHHARRINQLAQQCPKGPVRDHLNNLTIKHVHQSLEALSQFEQFLLKLYTSHANLDHERRQATLEIEQISRQLLTAPEHQTVTLGKLLQNKRDYLLALEELKTFQSQAELEVRKIAGDLATTHAEMLLVIARGDLNHNRLQRIDENLREHLSSLRDMMSVMDEIGYSRVVTSKA